MYLLYIDESGTSSVPGNTSHFVLAGISVPIWHWKDCDREISRIKQRYALDEAEIHTAWILRSYLEQRKIADFASLDYQQRRYQVERMRKEELLRLQRTGTPKHYRQTRKNFQKTRAYTHLTIEQRRQFVEEELFRLIFQRADRRGNTVVGMRHFTNDDCSCLICSRH